MTVEEFIDTVNSEGLETAVSAFYTADELEEIDEPSLAAAALAARWAIANIQNVIEDLNNLEEEAE